MAGVAMRRRSPRLAGVAPLYAPEDLPRLLRLPPAARCSAPIQQTRSPKRRRRWKKGVLASVDTPSDHVKVEGSPCKVDRVQGQPGPRWIEYKAAWVPFAQVKVEKFAIEEEIKVNLEKAQVEMEKGANESKVDQVQGAKEAKVKECDSHMHDDKAQVEMEKGANESKVDQVQGAEESKVNEWDSHMHDASYACPECGESMWSAPAMGWKTCRLCGFPARLGTAWWFN